MTILTFPNAFGETDIGWWDPGVEGHLQKGGLHIVANIPPNFVILKATILLSHIPCRNEYYTGPSSSVFYWGYARKLKAYIMDDLDNLYYERYGWNMDPDYTSIPQTEMISAFGVEGWTPTPPNDTVHKTEITESGDIKEYFQSGKVNLIHIVTSENEPTNNKVAETLKRSSVASTTLNVIGYISIPE